MNQKTIKFRFWDEIYREMIYMKDCTSWGDFWDSVNPNYEENKVLLQFTGLLDKNGKEIYEGDIVKWDDKSNGKYQRKGIIEWKPSHYFIKDVIGGGEFHFGAFIYEDKPEELEIIGNIYENKELLK